MLHARQLALDVYYELHLDKRKPNGYCARASARLFELLTASGYEAAIHRVQGGAEWGHCFVVVKIECRWFVLDLTYTQFDPFAPAILTEPYGQYKVRLNDGPAKDTGYTECWTSNLKHFKKHLIAGWPNCQKPVAMVFA